MNRAAEIENAQSDGYENVLYIEGKGLCGVYKQYLFTVALAINIQPWDDKGVYMHEYRYCYDPKDYHTLLMTLLSWSMSSEPVPDDPEDSKWIKKKGGGYDTGNPRRN